MITDKASSGYCRELEAQIRGHVCKCGRELNVAWVNGEYHIKCNACGIDPELVKVKSYWQMWNDGEPVPSYIRQWMQRAEDKERRKRDGS